MAHQSRIPLTVVLVHGTFTGPSQWLAVATQLRQAGVAAHLADNPLRQLAGDAESVAGQARAIAGRVLLAGHAYGGAVITSAAAQVDNAVGLVYVCGYALDTDESVADIDARYPPELPPGAPRLGGVPAHVFRSVVAGDLPAATTASMAAARPAAAAACFTDRLAGPPAWRHLPSWYVVAADDHVVNPRAQRFMATRAGSHLTETAGSHAVAVSQPTAVTDAVLTAAHVLARNPNLEET